jgi:hypothetical protein
MLVQIVIPVNRRFHRACGLMARIVLTHKHAEFA